MWKHSICVLLLEYQQNEGFRLEGITYLWSRARKILFRNCLLVIIWFLLLFAAVEIVCKFVWVGIWALAANSVAELFPSAVILGRGLSLSLTSPVMNVYFFLERVKERLLEMLLVWKCWSSIPKCGVCRVWLLGSWALHIPYLSVDVKQSLWIANHAIGFCCICWNVFTVVDIILTDLHVIIVDRP